MGTIDVLIPTAGQADGVGLLEVDAEELARYVIDTTHPWWRRRPCVLALAGRVPSVLVAELMERIRDPDDVTEVRIALLDLLGNREELLPWLRHQDRQAEKSYRMPEAILKGRGVLGDRTAARELSTLANDPWPHRREVAEVGLNALVARYGVAAIVADLGDERPEDRAFRVRVRHRAGGDVTEAFADPDVGVAHLAHSLVDDAEGVRAYVERAPTTDATLWAACALYRLGGGLPEIRAIYDSIGRPRVEVSGLDNEIRSAIVGEYVPGCKARTDPRWRLEAICVDSVLPPDEHDQLRGATTALASVNLAPKPPVSCGEEHSQGDGTYHVIEHRGGSVCVSTLGRFVTGDDANTVARDALEAAGFRWIDQALGSITVTGLCVYYFGDRTPLDLRTLLFYWQD
ncbi:hypothetical protein [Glycomyces buryatensis]|uniref:HEAT repeat domain-containing protein n=1 Tax=Glycomyces buryatensis TaxID=2570927 RepID=A0A4S8QHR6_9ACTN|nr:hypothetical protein [Glycomyces buryatensis]THV40939.1 hypothetical protein FAB82_13905 [Glycomyces buryatensis]